MDGSTLHQLQEPLYVTSILRQRIIPASLSVATACGKCIHCNQFVLLFRRLPSLSVREDVDVDIERLRVHAKASLYARVVKPLSLQY